MDPASFPEPPPNSDRLSLPDLISATAALDLEACLHWLIDRMGNGR